MIDRGLKRLMLSADQDVVVFELLTDRGRALAAARVTHTDYAPELIDSFLRSHGMRRADVSIGMRLAPESLFARKLLLPVESQRTLDVVVAQDLLAKTPFRLDDIFHDHFARRSGDKLCVWQWVVRRQLVAKSAEDLGLEIGDLESLEATGKHVDLLPRVRLQRTHADEYRWVRKVFIGLAFTACVLAGLAVGLQYRRPTAGTRCACGGARADPREGAACAQCTRQDGGGARRRSATPITKARWSGLLDIWEEVTHALPSHTWLTELRLSNEAGKEQQIVIAGFSSAAATLVGLLGRSPLFCNAALTGPISIDPTEGKERFVIQAKLRTLDPLKTAAR